MIDISTSCHFVGDCRALLDQLPDACVQTCITSSPYYGLRDYFPKGDPRHDQQIGLEASPEEFVAELVGVFAKVRRVLRDDGTLWLNIGDSYAGAPGGFQGKNGQRATRTFTARIDMRKGGGDLKPKDLVGIPWMLAFALRADGWYLRQDIIWSKPNPMPESVTDRCTKAHEYIFLLSKSATYFYDADAIATPSTWRGQKRNDKAPVASAMPGAPTHKGLRKLDDAPPSKCNKRSVWTVATQPYDGAHFATFPPALIEPCVLAGSRVGDLVLDPFFGSGTTGEVAEKHGRRWIGFDLGYEQLAKERTAQRSLLGRMT